MFVCFVVVVRQNFRLIYITKHYTDCHKVFHIGLFSYASRPKDNKNVDKQKNNADLNEIELLNSRRIKLGVRFEKRVSPHEKNIILHSNV